jgi:hypothetical protein
MLVSSFLLRWVLVYLILCLIDLRQGFSFFFSLFMVAMHNCFLARIVQERKFIKKLGAIVIRAAADDITAWCLLA